MQHEALAVRLGGVELGIGLRRHPEYLAPLPAEPQLEGIVEGVGGLVAENPHAPLELTAFHFEHLRFLQLGQPGVREVERDGHGGGAVGREPLVRQIEVQRKAKAARPQLVEKLPDAPGQLALDGQGQIGHPDVQELFVTEIHPFVIQQGARHGDNGIDEFANLRIHGFD
jgi:hypothetical protein